MIRTHLVWIALIQLAIVSPSFAHDTWVQAGPLVARYQDIVHVDLMLGNHGNNHRDFKLASKISLAKCTLQVISPEGQSIDLKPKLSDMGSAEKEGFWSARLVAEQKGIYSVVHTLDTLHGTTRAIKTGKSYFIASDSLQNIPTNGTQGMKPIGNGLELCLESPLEKLSANSEIVLKVLWNAKPRSDVNVSFIPRGAKLNSEFDPQYERTTDAEGVVRYVPDEGNYLLAVVHLPMPDEKGDGYDKTHYSATLVLSVPQAPYVH